MRVFSRGKAVAKHGRTESAMQNLCDTVVWRDAHDQDTIVFGRAYASRHDKPLYVAWFTCHIDALLDMFGQDVFQHVRNAAADEFPLPVAFAVSFDIES